MTDKFCEISLLDLPAIFICNFKSFLFLSSSESLGLSGGLENENLSSSLSRGIDFTSDTRGIDLVGFDISDLSGEYVGDLGVSSITGDDGDWFSLSMDLLSLSASRL